MSSKDTDATLFLQPVDNYKLQQDELVQQISLYTNIGGEVPNAPCPYHQSQ